MAFDYSAATPILKEVYLPALQELLNPKGIYEKSRPQQTRELEASGDSSSSPALMHA